MKKYAKLISFFSLFILFALDTSLASDSNFSGLNVVDAIKLQAISEEGGLPGDVVANDATAPMENETGACTPSSEDNEAPEKELKLIFLGERRSMPEDRESQQSNSASLPIYRVNTDDEDYQNLSEMSYEQIQQLAQNKGIGSNPEAITTLLMLGASQRYSQDSMNSIDANRETLNWLGDNIRQMDLNRDQQIELIASISRTLYQNYNDARNVTEESDNNPRYIATQAYGLFNSDLPGSRDYGGVCDDIAYFGCEIYQELNPDEDCLTMHMALPGGGQHFVMMVAEDGTEDYTTVNGGTITHDAGSSYLNMYGLQDAGMNVRLNRVNNGRHESISLVKSEYGRWVENALAQEGATGSSLVDDLDGAILDQIGSEFEASYSDAAKNSETNLKAGVRQGRLSNESEVVAIYALVDRQAQHSRVGVSLAYTNTRLPDREHQSTDDIYQFTSNGFGLISDREIVGTKVEEATLQSTFHRVHLNLNSSFGDERVFRANNHELKVHHFHGAYAQAMGGLLNLTETSSETYTDFQTGDVSESSSVNSQNLVLFDGNMGLESRVGVNYQNEETGTSVDAQGRVAFELAPRDWTRVHGLRSETAEALGEMNFMLNRVEANVQAEQRLGPRASMSAGVQYLGTNVGQNILGSVGFEFQIPQGMEVFVLTSYGAEMGGYMTEQNYLPRSGSDGVSVQGGIRAPGGAEASGGLSLDPSGEERPRGHFQIRVPVGGNRSED